MVTLASSFVKIVFKSDFVVCVLFVPLHTKAPFTLCTMLFTFRPNRKRSKSTHLHTRKENRPEFPNSSMTQKKRKSFVNRMNERSAKVVVQRLGPRLLLFFAAVDSIGSSYSRMNALIVYR